MTVVVHAIGDTEANDFGYFDPIIRIDGVL